MRSHHGKYSHSFKNKNGFQTARPNKMKNRNKKYTKKYAKKYAKKRTKKYHRKSWKGGRSHNFKHLNCHPSSKTSRATKTTCYDKNQLKYLQTIWNVKHPKDQIPTPASPTQIWNTLKRKYQKECDDEKCWISKLKTEGGNPALLRKTHPNTAIPTTSLTNSFAPNAPKEWKKSPNAWLSSDDIIKVMKQYETTYKCFEFIGPSPIDFDTRITDPAYKENEDDNCVWEELCNFSVKQQLEKGKTKIGVIFNTDPHYKSGEHWISLFINIKKGKIFFFDSVGNKAPKEIMVLVDRIIKQGLNQNPPIHFTFDQNYPVEHQYSNTECGVYSLYFIVHMLEDKLTGGYLKNHILTDKYIEKYRKIFFN